MNLTKRARFLRDDFSILPHFLNSLANHPNKNRETNYKFYLHLLKIAILKLTPKLVQLSQPLVVAWAACGFTSRNKMVILDNAQDHGNNFILGYSSVLCMCKFVYLFLSIIVLLSCGPG